MDENKKYEVIKSLADHKDRNGNTASKQRAALTLGCTVRHINRMLAGYKEHGKEFFSHGNKGRKPAITIPEDVRANVIDLYRNKYYDANFTHFTELLESVEGISLSPSCVANILENEYILSPRVTKAKKKRIKKELEAKKRSRKNEKGKGYGPDKPGCRGRCPFQTPPCRLFRRTPADGCIFLPLVRKRNYNAPCGD